MGSILKLIILCVICKLASPQITTFINPIVDTPIRGASILKINEFYYLVHADNGNNELEILKSSFLSDFRWAEKQVMYNLPSGFDSFFPAAFFEYQNELYFYFHMSFHSVNSMYVIKADDPKNPSGNWSTHTAVLGQVWNETAIHGAPFELSNELYFVWTSPSANNTKWNFYIAKMENPTKVTEPVVLLREPNATWECHGSCTVHAPSFLHNGDKMYMVFSASSSSSPETSISYMSIRLGLDAMQVSNWEAFSTPAFEGCSDESVYSTRFPEFTTSPDDTEVWMVYTASSDTANIESSSRVRIEKMEWDEVYESPKFPADCARVTEQELPSGEPPKFFNPLRDDFIIESAVYRNEDFYYMVFHNTSDLLILKSDKLYDFRNAEQAVVYRAPTGYGFNMGGRIQEVNGDVFIYFNMRSSSTPYQMFVTKCENKSNLMQNWGPPTLMLQGVFQYGAFHGITWQHNGQLYFVWCFMNSGRWDNVIYIAPMSSPTEVIAPVVLLKEPKQAWECHGRCINRYPAFLYGNNSTFLVFTASDVVADRSLTYMSIKNGNDPLNVSNWSVAPGPVFLKNVEENVFAPGDVGFTTSPDGAETWMIYRATDTASNAHGFKTRIQKISWNEETGEPIFPTAHGYTYKQVIPSNKETIF